MEELAPTVKNVPYVAEFIYVYITHGNEAFVDTRTRYYLMIQHYPTRQGRRFA